MNMDPIINGGIAFAAVLILMVLNIPIGIAMLLVGFAGFALISGFDPDSPGYGIVSYRGSHWNAKSDTSFHTQGTRVSVIGRSSTTLIV